MLTVSALWPEEDLTGQGLNLLERVVLQSKAEAAAYHKLLVTRLKEQRERRSESLAKKRAIRQASQASRELSQASKE